MPEKQIIIERTIDAPIERVWKTLTDYDEVKEWLSFFPDFKAEVGFRTEFELGPDEEHQYHHVVEVLAVEQGKRLTYSWDYGGMSPGSDVTFELIPDGEQTKLLLTCNIAKIPTDEADFTKNADAGWNYTADGLKRYAERNES